MMVEFIGSTGAGKTTLAAEVRHSLAHARGDARVATSIDLVAERLRCRAPVHPTRQNLLADIVGFPFFLLSAPRHRAFTLFALRFLARQRGRWLVGANVVRNVVRKLGTYEIVRRHAADRIVLVDEGTVLAAHNLFGHPDLVRRRDDLATFARLVPLPEAIVCVTAPIGHLVRRCLDRPDAPRAVRSRDESLVEQHVRRAAAMFDELVLAPGIRERVLVVENAADTQHARGGAVDRIVRFLLERQADALEPRLLRR